ncbi:hypothetical protein NFX46_04380 [Streptomyces phaeoluteigriseus]|uniref:Integral membrane protein n=1 Tax=Streptomyces phaeoluteigriseus TaxID=114686 RepID=A0ABY4Z222_9ACTN|nr:hypothetical protein [Streptomyces phaeoluteigriseus]USQ83081.1 hypothetical protein NFX46_04380 [Streptomyces phaeoluteigriseus]
MSFGEPNNPYGPPPQQPPNTPGYGVPQTPSYPQQPYPQQAYPQQPYPPQYPGGYHPGGPAEMPRPTRVAQILVGVIALAHAILAGAYVYFLTQWDEVMTEAGITGDAEAERFADLGKGVVVFFLGLASVFAILGLVLLLQYAKGGNTVRVCSIVYSSFAIVTGIFMLAYWGLGLLLMAVSIVAIVLSAKRESAAWFQRPRY